jgi:hypothetical protein
VRRRLGMNGKSTATAAAAVMTQAALI